jgi:KipI family sensor histidine kinase inhibitor
MPQTASIPEPTCELLGDAGLLLTWADADDAAIEAAVHAARRCLASVADPSVTGLVPGWCTLAVLFNPLLVTAEDLEVRVRDALQRAGLMECSACSVVRIPVSFRADAAMDLPDVARACGVSAASCIEVLTGTEFRVRMIGFAPGFPYLAGLPEVLHLPRRATPRMSVPAGSLAIAGGLAGIYPQSSPGGWHVVGRVLVPLFSLQQTPACLLQPGDRVQLFAVDEYGEPGA